MPIFERQDPLIGSDAPGNMAAAWIQYFRYLGFGAKPPKIAIDVMPTVVMDDNSKGPFPFYRPLVGGLNINGGAATFPEVEIVNVDPPESRSVLVIDWIQYAFSGAAFLLHGMSIPFQGLDGPFLAANGLLFLDQGTERDMPPLNANAPLVGVPSPMAPLPGQKIANQGMWGRATAVQTLAENVNAAAFQTIDTNPHTLPGPWFIGPGSALFLTATSVNVGLRVYARGRYYPGKYTTL